VDELKQRKGTSMETMLCILIGGLMAIAGGIAGQEFWYWYYDKKRRKMVRR
jgi:hypothetical protein